MGRPVLELFPHGEELGLEIHDPASRMETGFELMGIKRFGDVVVRSGIQTCDDILLVALCGEEDNVRILLSRSFPYLFANLDTIHAGHHPVEYCQSGGFPILEHLHGLFAVTSDHDFVAPFSQGGFYDSARYRIIFCNQNSIHAAFSMIKAASVFLRLPISRSRSKYAASAFARSALRPMFSSSRALAIFTGYGTHWLSINRWLQPTWQEA